MMETDIAVLGAGFAGLGAGYGAQEKQRETVIFEQDATYGGLCGNFSTNGFRFDKAVHLSFADDDLCKKIFFREPHYKYTPEASNYKLGFWVRHPVQNNLRSLPVTERISIIDGFLHRKIFNAGEIYSYRDWLETQFGQYFTDNYSELYTRKYWGSSSRKLSYTWCTPRIYQPNWKEILEGAFPDAPEPENVYYAKQMKYPCTGGFKQFVHEIAENLDIRYQCSVKKINTEKKVIYIENGVECHYNQLISTIPLPELVPMITSNSRSCERAKRLKATSMTLVSVGFSCEIKFPALWFYVYDEDIPFARVHSPSMKSPDNVPKGKSSLQFEIYHSEEYPLTVEDGQLIEDVLDAMERMKLAERKDVEVVDVSHIKYANVIFYHGMETIREEVRKELKKQEVITCGRFGEWDYLWSGQSFLSGYQAGKDLL